MDDKTWELLIGKINSIENQLTDHKTILEELREFRWKTAGVLLVVSVLSGALWTLAYKFVTIYAF